MNYFHVDNNKKELIIVFQSAGRITSKMMDSILEGDIDPKEVKEAHEKYTWFKISRRTYADYLYIEDYYSSSYGWYMFDHGRSIIDELNNEITEYITQNEYEKVTAFGSSKGATAALLYGIINPNINNVFACVPRVHVLKSINRNWIKWKELFFPEDVKADEDYFDNIFFNDEIYKGYNKNTKFVIYTGIKDEQFDETIKLFNFMEYKKLNCEIIINTSQKTHTNIVMENVPFVRSALKLIHSEKHIQGPRVVDIKRGAKLLRDK